VERDGHLWRLLGVYLNHSALAEKAVAFETLHGAYFKHISNQECLNSAHDVMQKEPHLNRT